MTEDLKGEALCETYRAELERLYGEARAKKSRVDYHRGWYYIDIARVSSDGSMRTLGMTRARRHEQVLWMLENLRQREPQGDST